jgi:hypothetical protein
MTNLTIADGHYQRSQKWQEYEKILAARKDIEQSGIEAEEIFRESKSQLERNSLGPGSSPG